MEKKKVAIIMGSKSDLPTMQFAIDIIAQFKLPYDVQVVSAHRTPEYMFSFAQTAADNGFAVIIAGAGGAAHLPGMVAALTSLPVIGVPIQSKTLNGLDSLLSIVQMPGGVPVATMAIGDAGARNAGLFAVKILALSDPGLQTQLDRYRKEQAQIVLDQTEIERQ